MNVPYLLCLPALLTLATIAFARLIHMTRAQWSFGHHVRRLGFVMILGSAASMIFAPFTSDGWAYGQLSYRSVLWAWGLTFVWVNSPGMPPLADYILGVHRQVENWRHLSIRQRIAEEFRAFKRSFRGKPS